MRLLLLEDDLTIGEGLADYMRSEGHSVEWFKRIEQAKSRILEPFDVWLLDWNLPDGSAVEWLASLRSAAMNTPAILLTSRDLLADRILGLDSGADDFMIKPFAPEELCARIRSLTRRMNGGFLTQRWGHIEVNASTKQAWSNGLLMTLTGKEWAILEVLINRPGRIVPRSDIESLIYDYAHADLTSNAIEVHLSSLRKKLGKHLIETHRGLGYRIRPPDPVAPP